MSHSNFIARPYTHNSGVSEKDMNVELRIHCKFCSKSPKSSNQIRMPMKAMMLREKQHYEAGNFQIVHNHH